MFSEEIILGLISFAQWMIHLAKWFLITAIVCSVLAIICYLVVILSDRKVRYKLLKTIRTISSI